jgi:small subunit ribosomal protein S13
LGSNLIFSQKVKIALTKICGVGSKKALQICDQLGLSDNIKVGQLSKFQLDQITNIISHHYFIDSELRRVIQTDIKRLISIGSYRGFRHNEGLPLRGQRTHTNAKTCRKITPRLRSGAFERKKVVPLSRGGQWSAQR